MWLNLAHSEVQMGKPEFLGAEPLKKSSWRNKANQSCVHVNISCVTQVSLNACGFKRRWRTIEANRQEGFMAEIQEPRAELPEGGDLWESQLAFSELLSLEDEGLHTTAHPLRGRGEGISACRETVQRGNLPTGGGLGDLRPRADVSNCSSKARRIISLRETSEGNKKDHCLQSQPLLAHSM